MKRAIEAATSCSVPWPRPRLFAAISVAIFRDDPLIHAGPPLYGLVALRHLEPMIRRPVFRAMPAEEARMPDAESSWRRSSGLAFWSFRTCDPAADGGLPACPKGPSALSAWIGDCVVRSIEVLPPFATAVRLLLETRDGGEASRALDLPAAPLTQDLRQRWAGKELTAARLTLDLHALDIESRPLLLKNGAALIVEPSFDERGEVQEGSGVELRLSLNVDIYAPYNPTPQRDNRTLARLNGPRLSGFLMRLQHAVPCGFELASGDDHTDLLSARGFEPVD